MSRNNAIFVGKLSSRTRQSDLEDEFAKYGKIRQVDFHKDRGFAFIEFQHSEDAKDSVDEMDGRRIDGSRIVV
jgi:RNA recognition motif-containing protein